jgi:hypothetical protein
MKLKIGLTAAVLFALSVLHGLFNKVSTLYSGELAAYQMLNSNAGYAANDLFLSTMSTLQFVIAALAAWAVFSIWWPVVKKHFDTPMKPLLLIGALLYGAHTDHAWAFAETTDKTEVYTILPNQSAFWVPDVGANKESQTAFESEAYYNERKVAAKRFIIPHAKLSGSGGTSLLSGWDYYVPTGRLFIVDRTPYSREWVDSTNRGTSAKHEGFPCQSKEGLNITVGISIGTSVTEENAAKFLYNFGVTAPKGNPTDPQFIFTSVYYGRSLENVMDDVGRKKVQTLVCNEIGKRGFEKANEDIIPMMDQIEKSTKAYFESVGITLNFIGWADTFEFDPEIQSALNHKYEADKLAAAIPVLQQVATLRVQEGLGKGLENHGLPIVVTPQMIEALMHLVPTVGTAAVLDGVKK